MGLLDALLGDGLPGPMGMPQGGMPGPIGGFGGGTFNIDGSQATPVNNIPPMQGDPTAITNDANLNEVAVKGWAPHKRSLLGVLGDALIMSQGGKPIFAIKKRRQNMQEMMEGFTKDPLETIRRMAQIPGMQGKAMEYLNQYQDNQRQQAIADRQMQAYQDKAMDNIGAMYGAATEKNFSRVNDLVRRYATSHGLDPDEIGLPTEYDPDTIQVFRQGGMSVDQQYDNRRQDVNTGSLIEAREANTAHNEASLANSTRNVDSQISSRDARLEETNRHNEVMENKPSGKTGKKGKEESRYVKTKYGLGMVLGNMMRVKLDGGKIAIYTAAGPDKWQLVEIK